MLLTAQDIEQQTITNKSIFIDVEDEISKGECVVETSLSKIIGIKSQAGDILIKWRHDGHDGDEISTDYVVIPRLLIESHFLASNAEYKNGELIAICLDNGIYMSMEEVIQPWAGDVYTGLYNTNYNGIIDPDCNDTILDNESNEYEPWLSEIDGVENTNKVIWLINESIDNNGNFEVKIKCAHEASATRLYNDLYDELTRLRLNVDNISHYDIYVIVKDVNYHTIVRDIVEQSDNYGVSVLQIDRFFKEAKKSIADMTGIENYDDNTSLVWKETTYDNNYYIDHNNKKQPITVTYKYDPTIDTDAEDNTNFNGMIYVGNTNADIEMNLSYPTYSISSNAFMYAKYYNESEERKNLTPDNTWYIGAKEEMHNLMNYDALLNINETINMLNSGLNKNYKTIEQLDNPNYLTSSTPWYNTNYCYTIYTYYRYVTALDKRVCCRVRLLLNLIEDTKIEAAPQQA